MSVSARDLLPDRERRPTHDGLHVAELEIARNEDRLNEKLVAGFGIGWRVLLHRLEEDY